MSTYFATLDPHVLGGPVSWAGPDPAPVWLDLAREFTERWHHQQHIRDAVHQPGLTEPRYLQPVLATFVHALPQIHTKRNRPLVEGDNYPVLHRRALTNCQALSRIFVTGSA